MGQGPAVISRRAALIGAAAVLAGDDYRALSDTGRDAVYALHEAGHYQLPGDGEA